MVIGTPNTGSTWLCNLIAECSDLRYYDKEFFNPATNPIYRSELETVFGCEWADTIANIAAAHDLVEGVIGSTWRKAGIWDFDKENYSAWRVKDYVKAGFDIIRLKRKPSSVFPPLRGRVWCFYDAIFHSMVINHRTSKCGLKIAERAFIAFSESWKVIDAAAPGSPVIDYDKLMSVSKVQIEDIIRSAFGDRVDHRLAARRICEERRPVQKTWGGPNCVF